MNGAENKVILDSSAWLEYFTTKNQKMLPYLETDNYIIYTSALSIYEIKKTLKKYKYPENAITNALNFLREKSIVADATDELCAAAVDNHLKFNLYALDAIIYTTARHLDVELITFDTDFSKVPNVKVLAK